MMTTDIVTLPLLGTLTAKEWHLFVVLVIVFFTIAVTPLRAALRTDWWYGVAGAFAGALAGFAVAAAAGWV
jgi:hypothetical protein